MGILTWSAQDANLATLDCLLRACQDDLQVWQQSALASCLIALNPPSRTFVCALLSLWRLSTCCTLGLHFECIGAVYEIFLLY